MAREAAAVAARAFVVHSRDAAETQALGACLGAVARPGDRIALVGPLGAGKTQLAKGFARGLGIEEVVNSPTFTLMAEYAGRLPLFHLDLYRLSGPEDAREGGLLDERQATGVTLVEWAERLGSALDGGRLDVVIDVPDDDERRIELRAHDAAHARYVEAARALALGRDVR